ncbi:hypothetical protein Tco_1139674 [Tanacetum coccineum]
MRKHRYGYLEEIVVRRDDNALYRLKEGDDVTDFAIALRMFTRSLVIQRGVKDLQLGVKSYQKKINVTKPDKTRSQKKAPVHSIQRPLRIHLCRRLQEEQNIDMEYFTEKKMEKLGKEKSLFHNQGHQQAAKGKEDDEEFGEIYW